MTKTPEQMAEEEADRIERQAILCVSLLAMNDGEYFAAKKAYKAGYQAAKSEDKAEWDAAHERMVAEYEANSSNSSNSSDDSDTPDLQEQIEALQQYMTVAQRKIMALQGNVDFLIYLSRDKMGDEQALRRMDAVMKGFGRNND